jgi:hypothetical protein
MYVIPEVSSLEMLADMSSETSVPRRKPDGSTPLKNFCRTFTPTAAKNLNPA